MMTTLRKALLTGAACVLGLAGTALAPQAEAKNTPADFGERISIYDAAISPQGNKFALIQNNGGEYIVRLVDTTDKSGALKAVGLGKGVKPQYVKWVNDNRFVVSVRQKENDRGTVFNTSFLHTIDADTMDARVLVRPRKGFRQFNDRVLDWLEDDPDHILMQFASDGADQNFPHVQKVRVTDGVNRIVKRQTNRINRWITDSQGEPRVGLGSRKKGEETYMTIRDPEVDKWNSYKDYPGIDPDTQYIVAVADEGRSLVLSAYRGKDTRGLHRYDLVNKRFAEVIYQNDEYDVSDVIMSKDGNDIVGASFTGESDERVLFDEYDSTFEEALAMFDGFQVDFIDQNADSTLMLIRVSSPSNPGAMYLFERGGGVMKLGDNRPGLEPERMGEVISIKYTARDGQKIPAFVTLPAGLEVGTSPSNLPFIILPHGGPYARDSKRFDYFAQFFAAQGYGVLQMNFRGSEGYGKSFAEAGRSNWVVMQEDVEDGMRYLMKKGYADPERTCIAGWSYGGYAALMGAAKDPELYNCVVAVAALTDIRLAARDMRGYVNGRAMADRFFGDMLKDGDLMKANNPVDVADNISVPVFLAHGDKDVNVGINQYHRMVKALKGKPVDKMMFKGEDHFMSIEENRIEMLKGIAKFLRKHNGRSEYAASGN